MGLAGAASAADLAVKAMPAAPVPFTWSGCFIGGHLGGVVSQDTRGIIDFSSTGFVGGGQIGCDYQFASNWVVGVEDRAAWTSMGGSRPGAVTSFVTGLTVPSQFTLRNDFLASATARLGYSFAPRWLVFARGGGAWTREKIDDAFTSTVSGLAVDPGTTRTRTGWTAGTGVEWAFAPHWSASVEYNYYNFGGGSVLLTGPTNTVIVYSLKDTIHAVTTGVNYRF